MLTQQSARDALRKAGVRLTPQRLMIVDALVDNRTHPTVEQIYEIVRQHYPTLSLATVYQTVSLLAQHGLILELHGGVHCLHCDPDTSLHAHAYCRGCGTVFDLALQAPAAWDEGTLAGFQATQVEVSIYGYCPACAVKLNVENPETDN